MSQDSSDDGEDSFRDGLNGDFKELRISLISGIENIQFLLLLNKNLTINEVSFVLVTDANIFRNVCLLTLAEAEEGRQNIKITLQ